MTDPQRTTPPVPPAQTAAPSATATLPAKPSDRKPIDFIADELFNRKEFFLALMPDREMLERYLRVMQSRVGRDTRLSRCHPVTIARAFQHCTELKLDPSPALQLVAFVPRWNKNLPDFYQHGRRGAWELTVQTTYRGYVQLMARAGNISSVEGAVRYEKDKWEYEQGLMPVLKHTPSDEPDPGKMMGAWALVRFKDGSTPHAEYLPAWRIEKVRETSAGRDAQGKIVGPWIEWPDEQWVKTVLKHLAKKVPTAVEAQAASAIEEAEEQGRDVGVVPFDGDLPGLEPNGESTPKSARLGAKIAEKTGTAGAPPGVPTTPPPPGSESSPPASGDANNANIGAGNTIPPSAEEAAEIHRREEEQARLQFGDAPPGR